MIGRLAEKIRSSAQRGPELVPGLLALAVFALWTASEGGFLVTSSNPGALFLAGLLVVCALAFANRGTVLAVVLLFAFAGWCFLSIAWSDSQGDAWNGANRMLLYAITFALFALPAWRVVSSSIVLGAYSAVVCGIGVVAVVLAASSSDPSLDFVGGRMIEPSGYSNSNAALFLAAFFPALALASRRETPIGARALLLAVSGVLLELALLPQSRGSLVAFPIATAIFLALVPGRLRSLIAAIPVAAALALSAAPILGVYEAVNQGDRPGAAIDDAVRALALSFAGLVAVGVAYGLADRRLRVSDRTVARASRTVGAAAVLTGVVAAAIAVAAVGNPVSWASDRWQDFKRGPEEPSQGSRLTSSLGSNRYDFWRVALSEQFTSSPVTGEGIESFAVDYVRERESGEEPLHPHSLPIKVLSQTGLIGALLFGGFLTAAIAAAVRARRRLDVAGRVIWGAALTAFAYWFVHAAGDWLIALPALAAPAFAWLALAGRLRAADGDPGDRPNPGRGAVRPAPAARSRRPAFRIAAVAAAAGALIAAAASYLPPWAAEVETQRALRGWGTDPALAFERLHRARSLNPLSERADAIEGTIALRVGDRDRARDAFERVLERQPENWYALLELGALEASAGRTEAAVARLERAAELNPRAGVIRFALDNARAGRPVSTAQVDRRLRQQWCARLGRTAVSESCPDD